MAISGTTRLYGGATGEQRVAARRRKLIEAGLTLFGSAERGIVRVKDVAAEAHLTERYFYESFSDLAALFEAVLDHTMETIETAVNTAVLAAPDRGISGVSSALRAIVDELGNDPRMIQIFFVEALGRGGHAASRRNEMIERSAANFFKWSSAAEENSFNSSTVDTRMKSLALAGAVSELLVSWAEGLLDITSDELSDFLVGLYWRTNLP
ncbi:TetR/AcrR family transcriptional regulator [Mycolicibacterium porcinum]|uniref:TetR/AcrR family transcriptional regulator n=1 Tax=Mycolicibacterium porcinum TaxID=39693 RepID=UPI000687FE98|nr:TetR/AcrR family transcriptional regulator [Mycolicibacterium porcinum]ORB39005.1 TetR family transcriptional regulator [Mycolicibacterium porcinum]